MNVVSRDRDAYGRELSAFLSGKGDPFEIVERDDGYISAAPSVAGYFAGFRRWPWRQREAIRYRRGQTALDVGCGAGRVALYLQERRFHVTGIDNSPLAVRTARRRGLRDARVLPLERIHQLQANRFDTVIMFGNNFGLFSGYLRARRLLRQLHRITKPGAVLLAESIDPHQTTDAAHRHYQRANIKRGRLPGQIRIRVRYRDCAGPWFDYLLVSRHEMEEILNDTGWHAERFIGDAGSAYVAVIERV
jgi:SAM-dependent methyltransferase